MVPLLRLERRCPNGHRPSTCCVYQFHHRGKFYVIFVEVTTEQKFITIKSILIISTKVKNISSHECIIVRGTLLGAVIIFGITIMSYRQNYSGQRQLLMDTSHCNINKASVGPQTPSTLTSQPGKHISRSAAG